MQRRTFLKAALAAGTATALGPDWWRAAYAASATPAPGRYGEPTVLDAATGIVLPPGFSVRELARSTRVVAGTAYPWHVAPDGGATFPLPDGGWAYTSNSETLLGGASAIRFDAAGQVVDAYRILTGTALNCAGGPTPWGTWLSCEEHPQGQVWECGVAGPGTGVALPLLGRFSHEAAAVDEVGRAVYLTEDNAVGRLYRFRPTAYPDLTSGTLEAAVVGAPGPDGSAPVTWEVVPEPSPPGGHRSAATTAFNGGEGAWIDRGTLYFTTKGDNRVWALDLAAQRLSVLYDAVELAGRGVVPPLSGVDNVVAHVPTGDLFVAEDGGDLEICYVSPADGTVSRFLRVTGQPASELCGPAFSPDGSRLYFSSQRGASGNISGEDGRTYEVTGPFVVGPSAVVPEVPTALALPLVAAGALAAGAVALRRRPAPAPTPPSTSPPAAS